MGRILGAPRDAWLVRRSSHRSSSGAGRLSVMGDDMRIAVRSLTRSPAFFLIAVAILSIGIGVNTAVVSLAYDALAGTLPFPDGDRLVHVWERRPEQSRDRNPASLPDFTDWRERGASFQGMAAIRGVERNLSGGERPEPMFGARVTMDFLSVLSVAPALGRAFTEDEMRPPGEPVALLSHGLWRDAFGSDADILGQTVRIDLEPHTIIGIMPPDFGFPTGARFWTPLGDDPVTASRGSHGHTVIARLNDGVTVEQAWADLDAVAHSLEAEYPNSNAGHYTAVYPLRDELLGDTRSALKLLLSAVGFVLLIVCVNVANMELARSSKRGRDMAIRAIMGATRVRLVRLVLAESLVMAAVAGALSVAVAMGTHVWLRASAASNVPWSTQLQPDARVLAFAVLLSLATALLFGLAPALQASRVDLSERLAEGSQRSGLGVGGRRMQGSLVITQVALALVLLVGAGVFTRNILGLLALDTGFEVSDVVTADVFLPATRYDSAADRLRFYRALEERLAVLPGAETSALAWILPMSGRNVGRNFILDGRDPSENGDELSLRLRVVSASYFDAMSIPLVAGRNFHAGDSEDAPSVALASETLARLYWPDEDPVGQRLAWGSGMPWITIVGVVGDVRHDGPAYPADSELYLPLAQSPPATASIVVRSSAPLATVSRSIQAAIGEIDPDQAAGRIVRLEDTLAERVGRQRGLARVIAVFALVALALAAMGIYGVVSYTVSQRTREFGIRLALGGRSRRVLSEAMGGGARLVGVGLVLGVVVAAALSRTVESQLVGVNPRDPLSVIAASALLGVIALVAIYVPARHATRVDPVKSLNAE
jgi:putative ABC transport system permease protein